MKIKMAILFSGNGTNLEAIIKALHKKTIGSNYYEVVLCLTNKADAYGIQRAKNHGLKSVVLERENFASKELFDSKIVEYIKESAAALTVLVGFMHILGPIFTNQIQAINLHPSLLPLFKGADAIKRSYNSPELLGGASVHWVNEELDSGTIIMQESFEKANMSYEEFESKLHSLEHDLIVKSIIALF